MKMRAKTVLNLMSLSSNLYLMSRDKELMDRLKELKHVGRERFNEWLGEDEEEDDEKFLDKLISKAEQAKESMEEKVEEIAAKIYRKMNIAHTDEIKMLNEQIESLRNALGIAEAKIKSLEDKVTST
jgi:hypothetical protein